MVRTLIERSALILVLKEFEKDGIHISLLLTHFPSLKETLKHFANIGIQTEIIKSVVYLRTPVSFSLFQSVPPEIRNEVEEILYDLVPKPLVVTGDGLMQRIIQPNADKYNEIISQPDRIKVETDSYSHWLVSGTDKYPLACIHCYMPRCQIYDEFAFGPTDAFAAQLCPSSALFISTTDGSVILDPSKCSGCMLCIIRCPLHSIILVEGVAKKYEYTEIPNGSSYVDEQLGTSELKAETTSSFLNSVVKKIPAPVLNLSIVEILDNFDTKVSSSGLNWDLNPYYIWVRNCFRELGVTALYTGSAGKLKRADVTLTEPFFVGIEVKSPAEGDINVGALRQAIDASVEVGKTYGTHAYAAAIGQGVTRGVHAKALDYHSHLHPGFDIPLISGRFLLYLVLNHHFKLPQSPLHDIQRIFSENYGWLGQNEIKKYFMKYFDLRRNNLESKDIELPLPISVKLALKAKKPEIALGALNKLERATISEIESAFPDPVRTPRGRYSGK